MSEFGFTEHALRRMRQRGVLREQVEQCIAHPENVFIGHEGRTVCESLVKRDDGSREILRVVVDHGESPPVVVTVLLESNLSRFGGR